MKSMIAILIAAVFLASGCQLFDQDSRISEGNLDSELTQVQVSDSVPTVDADKSEPGFEGQDVQDAISLQ